jgi:hypothetical protein
MMRLNTIFYPNILKRLRAKDCKEILEQVTKERKDIIISLGSQPYNRLYIKTGECNNKREGMSMEGYINHVKKDFCTEEVGLDNTSKIERCIALYDE